LQLERDQTEDVVVVGVEVRRHRESATDGAPGTLVRPATERQAPALHARVDGAIRIETVGLSAEEPRVPVRGDDVEDHEGVPGDGAARDLGVGLRSPLDLRRRRRRRSVSRMTR